MITKSFFIKICLLIGILFLATYLRFYHLSSLTSPYWEEVALGYDAYSILKTGADHHGNFLPLVAFESFGDYKPSLYFYSLVPSIAAFGLNEFALRLPVALAGVFIVIGIGVLIGLITRKQNQFLILNYESLAAMFIAAVSPWAIMFSRAAWEVNLATALILWGINCFLIFIKLLNYSIYSKKWQLNHWAFYLLSIFLLSLSMYTYHAARIVAPFLGLSLIILWFASLELRIKNLGLRIVEFVKLFKFQLIVGLIFSLLLLSPLIFLLGSQTTNQRFKETSIFYDLEIIKESNARREAADNSVLSRLFYHRYVLFGREIVKNYFSYFTLDYLILSGDQNPRHSTEYFGTFYHLELIFLFFGAYYVLKNWNKKITFLDFWLFVGILPAAISKANPHALRTLLTLPIWIILITLGIKQLLLISSKWSNDLRIKWLNSVIVCIVVLAYFIELLSFWRYYTKVYPVVWGSEWQQGYAQLINEVEKFQNSNPKSQIFITRDKGRPAMYYWFYSQTNPKLVQAAEATAKKDQGEFLEFENIAFGDPPLELKQPALVASSQDFYQNYCVSEGESNKCQLISEIKSKNNQIVWVIYEVK